MAASPRHELPHSWLRSGGTRPPLRACVRSRSSPYEQLAQRHPRRFRQVRVNRRRGDVLVAEKRLDDAGVDLVLEEPGRIGVPQRVWRAAATAGEIGRLDGLGKGAGQDM